MENLDLKKQYEKCKDLANNLANELYKLENAKVLVGDERKKLSDFSSKVTELFYFLMDKYLSIKK